MENYNLDRDVTVFGVTASSFPAGVMEAHQKLHALIPPDDCRMYLGLSRPDQTGNIIYKATAEEQFPGEGAGFNCETILVKKGTYASIVIRDFMQDIPAIGNAFRELLAHPGLDHEGYCVEWYMNEKDVRCMVRLAGDNN